MTAEQARAQFDAWHEVCEPTMGSRNLCVDWVAPGDEADDCEDLDACPAFQPALTPSPRPCRPAGPPSPSDEPHGMHGAGQIARLTLARGCVARELSPFRADDEVFIERNRIHGGPCKWPNGTCFGLDHYRD